MSSVYGIRSSVLGIPRIVNLTFHGIGTASPCISEVERLVWLGTESFKAILDTFASIEGVRLTFDDGNKSDIDVALPALVERGLAGTFFVCAGRLGVPGYLTESDLRTLTQHGMAVGLHGMDHVPWRGLDRVTLNREINQASAIISSAIGGPVGSAACPFGAYDRRVLSALRRAGMDRVYTSDRGPATENSWLQARTTLQATDDACSACRVALARKSSPVRCARLFLKRLR